MKTPNPDAKDYGFLLRLTALQSPDVQWLSVGGLPRVCSLRLRLSSWPDGQWVGKLGKWMKTGDLTYLCIDTLGAIWH